MIYDEYMVSKKRAKEKAASRMAVRKGGRQK